MRDGQPKSFEGNQGRRIDGLLPEAHLKMKEAYIGRIERTMREGRADWGGYDKLARLANTSESEWDAADRAAQDFPGWTQEDFARLVRAVDLDPRFRELLSERNQSRKQSLDGGHEAQPESFDGRKSEQRESSSPKDYLEMKNAYVGRIERMTRDGYPDWSGYDKLVRLANTGEDGWNPEDRAKQDFPGWTQEDFARLVKAIHSDPGFQKLLKEKDSSSKRSPIFSPEDLRRERKEFTDKYDAFLQNYHDLVLDLRRARKKGRIDTDPELKAEMDVIDHERHETHLKLLDIARRLGKNADHVLVDIVRMEGDLATYGLPEFSILASEDFMPTKYWKGDRRVPVDKDSVVIVFGVAGISVDQMTDEVEFEEDAEEGPDFFIRAKRAKAFAKQMHGEYFDHSDSEYFHSRTVDVVGVEIPRSELERATKVIRDNPSKYRLGEQYYSAAEKAQIEKGQGHYDRRGSYNDDDDDDNED